MPIPTAVQDALAAWAQSKNTDRQAAECGLANALRTWIQIPQDGVAGDLVSVSHELLFELHRLGRWSMAALLDKFLADESRNGDLRAFVERKSRHYNLPSEVTNSVQSVIVRMLEKHSPMGADLATPAHLDAYLRTACENVLKDHLDKEAVYVPLESDDSIATRMHQRGTAEVVGDREVRQGKADTHRYMRSKIEALPVVERAMMTLAYHHGWDNATLADAFPLDPEAANGEAPSRATRTQQIRRMRLDIFQQIASEAADPWA